MQENAMDAAEWLMQHEMTIRLGFFFAVLLLMALWETRAPRRVPLTPKPVRWINNLGLVFVNSILLRLLFPAAAVGMAAFAAAEGWGLFNHYPLPQWVGVVLGVVALDLIIYLQHVMVHAVPVLWRFHRVHHADLDIDTTTGLRFHPVEIILSMLLKFAAIAALGPPVVAVLIFEVVLNAMSMFNHGNVRLPLWLDRWLRAIVVTPDMHRVHHSVEDDETNSNFGFNLSLWDWLFGTYRDQPRAGHEGMTIGIRRYRDPNDVTRLDGLLLLPLRGKISDYAINRRSWGDDDGRDD
jgi:sterol desaturase/sphingolipid hydroxylase (fatty acid hydroxylase superfamily)